MKRWILPLTCLALLMLFSCSDTNRTATMTIPVTEKPFRIVVRAEGSFIASKSTALNVDPNSGRTAIMVLAPEGRMVDQDEMLIELDGSRMSADLKLQEFRLAEGEVQVDTLRQEAKKENQDLDQTIAVLQQELAFTEKFARTDADQFSKMERETDATELELLRTKLTYYREKKARQDKKLQASVAAQQARLAYSHTHAKRLKKQLENLEIRAPHPGTFFHERTWRGPISVGDTVYPGMKLGNIPDLDSLVVDAYVLESEASGIVVDTPAEIRAAASPEQLVTGRVISVNPFAEKRSEDDPTKYFRVRLAFEGDRKPWMKPNGEVTVRFLVADIDKALAVPNQALFSGEGETWVYRRIGGGFEKQVVSLGQRGPNRTIIRNGLKAGDNIAPAQPTEGELE